MVRPLDAGALDNPAWGSLSGAHSWLAETDAEHRAGRYPTDVAPFAALDDSSDARCWTALASVVGRSRAALVGLDTAPRPWKVSWSIPIVQMTGTAVEAAVDPEAVRLGPDDVPDMLALVARTKPGPFGPRTIELGNYVGLRRDGALVAMAGERMHPPGWTEVSAVCTDIAHRGQGLGARLVRTVVAGIRERGEEPFLHAAVDNTGAIALYERMGFELRRSTTVRIVRALRHSDEAAGAKRRSPRA
jgi:ribosomal protein S18 acetylase RimI-like enzyme